MTLNSTSDRAEVFVHDQDLGLEGQCLGDLNELLADAEILEAFR